MITKTASILYLVIVVGGGQYCHGNDGKAYTAGWAVSIPGVVIGGCVLVLKLCYYCKEDNEDSETTPLPVENPLEQTEHQGFV